MGLGGGKGGKGAGKGGGKGRGMGKGTSGISGLLGGKFNGNRMYGYPGMMGSSAGGKFNMLSPFMGGFFNPMMNGAMGGMGMFPGMIGGFPGMPWGPPPFQQQPQQNMPQQPGAQGQTAQGQSANGSGMGQTQQRGQPAPAPPPSPAYNPYEGGWSHGDGNGGYTFQADLKHPNQRGSQVSLWTGGPTSWGGSQWGNQFGQQQTGQSNGVAPVLQAATSKPSGGFGSGTSWFQQDLADPRVNR